MKKWSRGGILFRNRDMKRDDRGSAIVIVIIAMAMIGILATTIVWASYINYRIKINDLKVKNNFYSAETIVEQIVAGVKKDVVSKSINEAYQQVISNWDALATDSNRESYFVMAYIESVEEKLKVSPAGSPNRYDKSLLHDYVDTAFWTEGNPEGYIVNKTWDDAVPEFKAANEVNGYGSMVLKNICIEFYDSNGYLSVINTDIAIDVPKLRFTQAGTIDRLYPYTLIGGTGIESEGAATVAIKGSIYGGVDDTNKGGIQIGEKSSVTIEDASYVISDADIVVGNSPLFTSLINQGSKLVIRDVKEDGKSFRTNIYAKGLAVNGSHLDVSGRMYVANDLILSGKGSRVSLAGQYYGYGNTNASTNNATVEKKDDEGNPVLDGEGNPVMEDVAVNPASSSSAIVINGKDSTVDLLGLTTLQLAGRAYVSLPQEGEADNGLPHVLMGESISVKSNQVAYLVPPECVGTLDGKTIIGQNPIPFTTWSEMLNSLSVYQEKGKDFRIVNASKDAVKLGNKTLSSYGIADITADNLSGVDLTDSLAAITALNQVAASNGVRILYMPEKQQVYLYLVMDDKHASEYFAQYYNVNSNKASLDNYFNQYVSGGIKLQNDVKGYTVVGNSMVSAMDADNNIRVSDQGQKLVRLLSAVDNTEEEGEGEEEEGEEEEGSSEVETGDYQEVSDNVETVLGEKNQEELAEIIENCGKKYENLTKNLLEEDAGSEQTVFENLVRLHTNPTDPEGIVGLQEYLDAQGGSDGKVEFTSGDGLKAVLVDCSKQSGDVYKVNDTKLRLVVAIGDVQVQKNFQGLILASGRITIADSVTIQKDGEGVYSVLQAKSEIEGDTNVPANILANGSGMVMNGYEAADVDESGYLNIDYSKIVRYENWIKK